MTSLVFIHSFIHSFIHLCRWQLYTLLVHKHGDIWRNGRVDPQKVTSLTTLPVTLNHHNLPIAHGKKIQGYLDEMDTAPTTPFRKMSYSLRRLSISQAWVRKLISKDPREIPQATLNDRAGASTLVLTPPSLLTRKGSSPI